MVCVMWFLFIVNSNSHFNGIGVFFAAIIINIINHGKRIGIAVASHS